MLGRCSVCRRERRLTKGLCSAHYVRLRLGQDLDAPLRQPPGLLRGRIKHGYVVLYILKHRVGMEHRIVMERQLGRELRPDETIHHINGEREDNRIENLQLHQGGHRPGQKWKCAICGSHKLEALPL